MWKSLITLSMLRVLQVQLDIPVFNHEKYLALTTIRWVSGALFCIGTSSKSSQRQNWSPILMATWNRARSSGWLSQQWKRWMRLLWHPMSSRMVRHRYWRGSYQVCHSMGTQPWGRSITRCATKLILNCRHWDQSLHSYLPIISLSGPRSNPVFEYHQSPNPICESAINSPFMSTP